MTHRGSKILIVDDEPPMRKLLKVGLGADGYLVTEATNARTATERLAADAPDLVVDLVRRSVHLAGAEVHLTPKEYDLLRLMVQHAGRVLTHRFVLEHLWDQTADVQYLRVYMRQLRQKVEPVPEQPRYLMTETGVGYRLREADAKP